MGANLGRGETPQERVVSVGRVQLPVVKMVFDRDEEIKNFISVDHFKIKGDFTAAHIEANYTPEVTKEVIESEPKGVHWEPSKTVVEEGKEAPLDKPLFVDKDVVDSFKERLKAKSESFVIDDFSSRTKEKHPPKAFSLMSAQREIGKKFPKLDAEGLQAIVEDLYEQGWISYPRTEHEEIPKSFYEKDELIPLLNNLSKVPALKEMSELALNVHTGKSKEYKKFLPKGFSTKEMEHHGLLPTKQSMDGLKFSNLSAVKKGNRATPEMMQFSYLAIAKQYVQMLLPPAKIAEQKVDFSIDVEDLLGNKRSLFKAKAEQIVDPGWMAYSGSSKKDAVAINLKKGDTVTLNAIEVTSSKTTPPSPFTEIGLGEAMSNVGRNISDPKLKALLKHASGLGTPATRASIIKTVKTRGYLEVKGKNIHCTDKGADLLKVVPTRMTSPEMTAIWEDYLMQIQEEKDDSKAIEMRDQFVQKQKNSIEKLIHELEEKYRSKMGERRVSTSSKDRKPTEAMVKYAKTIADRSNGEIKIPRGLKTSFDICKAFLEEHGQQRDPSDNKPSEGQVKFANSIWSSLSEEVRGKLDLDDILSDRKKVSDFINEHKDKVSRKPSEAQINFAKKIADGLPEGTKIPSDIYENFDSCSKFINKYKSSGKKGTK